MKPARQRFAIIVFVLSIVGYFVGQSYLWYLFGKALAIANAWSGIENVGLNWLVLSVFVFSWLQLSILVVIDMFIFWSSGYKRRLYNDDTQMFSELVFDKLFFDDWEIKVKKPKEKLKSYFDKRYEEESEEWKKKYSEELNKLTRKK